MKIWLKVTKDEYQLPVAIGDTALELAKRCGTSEDVIRSQCSRYNKGKIKRPTYICVEIKEGKKNGAKSNDQ